MNSASGIGGYVPMQRKLSPGEQQMPNADNNAKKKPTLADYFNTPGAVPAEGRTPIAQLASRDGMQVNAPIVTNASLAAGYDQTMAQNPTMAPYNIDPGYARPAAPQAAPVAPPIQGIPQSNLMYRGPQAPLAPVMPGMQNPNTKQAPDQRMEDRSKQDFLKQLMMQIRGNR